MIKTVQLFNENIEFKQFLQDFNKRVEKKYLITGLHGSSVSFFISSLLDNEIHPSSKLLLFSSQEEALHFYQDLIELNGKSENRKILFFPSFEVRPYEDNTKDTRILEQRIKVLAALSQSLENNFQQKEAFFSQDIVISTYKAVLPKIMTVNDFKKLNYVLKVTDKIKIEDIQKHLINQGFESTYMIDYQGQFSIRGGIIDFFPFTEEDPIRIELNEDEIESIRFFDLATQRSLKKVSEISLQPQRELGEYKDKDEMEHSSIFDYLSVDSDIIIYKYSEFENRIEEYIKEIEQCYNAKKEESLKFLFPPAHYYLDYKQLKDLIKQKSHLVVLDEQKTPKNIKENKFKEYAINTQPTRSYFGQLDLFFEDLKNWQKENKTIMIIAQNKGRAVRMAEIFEDRAIKQYQLLSLEKAECASDFICLSYGKINYGFSIPDMQFLLLTDQEIFGRERDRSYRNKRYQGKPLYQVDELKKGDFLVHIHHGIGRYVGIRSRKTDGIQSDYLLIKYAADDELYVPVDQLNLVHKYIGAGDQSPKLYRLGGSTWDRVKRKVKDSIQKTARELFELYQNRKNIQGYSFSSDSVWQQELEMAFPFEETPDQNKAWSDVKKDMESVQPMERLICGDVGYGKTEIAIRAAFKAVMDNKQVAVLTPTTILTQQHWENFSERMKSFPVKIEMLSRFKSKKEQQKIITDLKKGKIDIVIGTHRLVQEDIVFHDLGLLIIDEEQRFGVIHKERIKKIKEQVDSLTLTATPIPRTLYFSLIGVREMSLMNTPPELRLPIVTYLREKENRIIQEAIRREIDREGQIYYVHNKVEDIDIVADQIKEIVPEARIVVAHGQMSEHILEKIMIDFLNKEYDVLVCTTIIEIGLDIPNVNTIIIDEAQNFGLSQLYQLRGRVGRTDRRAYAYLLYPDKKILTENARKRMQAIKEFSDLGSGFRLAMRDLEIRGAGNLLGKEQHGFVSEVGFNFYCKLLEDSISELKQIEAGESKEGERDPEIQLKIESYIPVSYISDAEKRVLYYQKLSQVKKSSDLEDIEQELKDIYGPYPYEISNLLSVIDLKLKVKNLGVTQIRINPSFIVYRYNRNSRFEKNLEKLEVKNSSLYKYNKGSINELKISVKNNGNSAVSGNIFQQNNLLLKKLRSENN